MASLEELVKQGTQQKTQEDKKRAEQKAENDRIAQEEKRLADEKAKVEKKKSLARLDKEVTKTFNALNQDKKATSQAMVNNLSTYIRIGAPNTTFGKCTNLFGWRNKKIGLHLTNEDVKKCIENNESFKKYAEEAKKIGYDIKINNTKLPNTTPLIHGLKLGVSTSATIGGASALVGGLTLVAALNPVGILGAFGLFPLVLGGVVTADYVIDEKSRSYASLSFSFEKIEQGQQGETAEENEDAQQLLDELNQQTTQQIEEKQAVPITAQQHIIK